MKTQKKQNRYGDNHYLSWRTCSRGILYLVLPIYLLFISGLLVLFSKSKFLDEKIPLR